MNNKKIKELFGTTKPIIGMIHLKGNSGKDIFRRAIREIALLEENGIDGVMIENYFGDEYNVEEVLEYLHTIRENLVYGVNILNDYYKSYELADKYGASFIQIDSVAGHLPHYEDKAFGKSLELLQETSNTILLGGVRFKYQPYLSNRSLEEDLKIGMNRCDAIVVTGAGTGKDTSLEKINEFRNIIGDFPLIVGAGLTTDNCISKLSIADGGIVGSYLKDNHRDNGEVSEVYTAEFMGRVKTLR